MEERRTASVGVVYTSVDGRACSSRKAQLKAARLEETTRDAIGAVHARVAPRAQLLVARLGVGGDGDKT